MTSHPLNTATPPSLYLLHIRDRWHGYTHTAHDSDTACATALLDWFTVHGTLDDDESAEVRATIATGDLEEAHALMDEYAGSSGHEWTHTEVSVAWLLQPADPETRFLAENATETVALLRQLLAHVGECPELGEVELEDKEQQTLDLLRDFMRRLGAQANA